MMPAIGRFRGWVEGWLFYLSGLEKRGVVFARFWVGSLLDLEAVHWVSCLIWLVVWMLRTLDGGILACLRFPFFFLFFLFFSLLFRLCYLGLRGLCPRLFCSLLLGNERKDRKQGKTTVIVGL